MAKNITSEYMLYPVLSQGTRIGGMILSDPEEMIAGVC